MMNYVIAYIIVSIILSFIFTLFLIKGSLLLWNEIKSQNMSLNLSKKNIFMIFIPATFVFWIGLTLFILANLKMH